MILMVLTILHITGSFTVRGQCPQPGNQKCFPPNGETCITGLQNGTQLNWFEMENTCALNGGRLVLMRNAFDQPHLTATTHISTQFLSIGMVMSFKPDEEIFWINPREKETFSCGTENTDICLLSATPEHCKTIGCCWLNGKCQYPELQRLTQANSSIVIDTSAVTKTERSCVGLEKNGTSWIWKAYNCSMPGVLGTGFVCENKCTNEWPDLPKMNISWIRPVLTTIPYADVTSTPNASTNVDSRPTVGYHISSQNTSDISNSPKITMPYADVTSTPNASTNVDSTPTAGHHVSSQNTSDISNIPKIDNGRNNSAFTFKKKVRRVASLQYLLYEYADYTGV